MLLHVSKDLAAMSTAWQSDFNALGSAAAEAGWEMYGLTNATAEEHEAYGGPRRCVVPVLDVRPN